MIPLHEHTQKRTDMEPVDLCLTVSFHLRSNAGQTLYSAFLSTHLQRFNLEESLAVDVRCRYLIGDYFFLCDTFPIMANIRKLVNTSCWEGAARPPPFAPIDNYLFY
jgi:hypothetical protein